ncbi:hypothetical protein CY34DRAFT_25496 [Suillus luteus UH-Slu-Lm8-n1]|uniref:Uncharacterized protein n=1 Tax=Suillus luteus UH-Slu-Lm8-n1 TaxID=930992 RepID=A0A0D0AL18_9AGAM|nr:hypothetical protein CY34DRAFT_25496 [Suillus luteus UH-Slu-Lm8-n1]
MYFFMVLLGVSGTLLYVALFLLVIGADRAYIVDTSETAMLACVHRKTSPFTMALHLQFVDNFWHPAHTCSITLGQLANIMVNPDDLKAYFEACADSWLNGWYIVVIEAQELDFQFSILQLTTGYHHFSDGISKLKRVTDRGHCDIQHYIVDLLFSAVPHCFAIVICALMDLHYLVQCPAPNDDLLTCAWMGTKRPIENWHIPKLELLQSITSSIHKVSTLLQWSICYHLDQEEKLQHFTIATWLKSHPTSHNPNFRAKDILEEDDLDDGDEPEINDP